MSKRVLITGGTGFIGHHLIEHLLVNTDWTFVCLDRIDKSSSIERLNEIFVGDKGKLNPGWSNRVSFVFHDLKAEFNSLLAKRIGRIDYILHLAAGSHVSFKPSTRKGCGQ